MDISQLYPRPRKSEEKKKRIRTSVHFSEEDHQDIGFFADLWTTYDEIQELDRKKWKNQTVIEQIVKVGLEGLWTQMKVARPKTKEEREELLRRAVAQFRKDLKLK